MLNLTPKYLPSSGTPERLIIERLADLNNYNSADLEDVSAGKVTRDLIKTLRIKYGYLIYTEKASWRLDERHILGNEKLERIARAEARCTHACNSLKGAKAGRKREPKAVQDSLEAVVALQKEKAE